MVGIPSGVTGVERRAVREAGLAGAREVHLIDEPVAAAIGAGLPVTEPVGTMIVDIGGGTTEVAVLSLGGTVLSESVRVAGDEISDSIGVHLKKVHNLVVGERTAEEIKIRIGSAFPDDEFDQTVMDVRGLHLLSGLPRTIQLQAGDLREAIAEPLNVIVEAVKRTLERTPPELAADILCSVWSRDAARYSRTTSVSSGCSTPLNSSELPLPSDRHGFLPVAAGFPAAFGSALVALAAAVVGAWLGAFQ